MSGSKDERRYSDREVRRLLERASREAAPGAGPVRKTGLTLGELEVAAAGAGIDVTRLRAAAAELDMEDAARPLGIGRLTGGPLRMQTVRTLSFEASEEDLHRLAATLNAIVGDMGEVRVHGRSVTWGAGTNGGRRTDVHVSVYRGSTIIEVNERYGELAGGIFGGVVGGVGVGAGIGGGGALAVAVGSAALAVALPAAVIGGTYAACRFGYRAYVRKRARNVSEICDRIEQQLAAGRMTTDSIGESGTLSADRVLRSGQEVQRRIQSEDSDVAL